MATGYLELPMLGAKPDVDSPPQITGYESSAAEPNPEYAGWAFSPTVIEYIHYQFRMPGDYASAPALAFLWQANVTTGDVVWACRVSAVSPTDADTPNEHAAAAIQNIATTVNTVEANRLVLSNLTISNTDSLASGDLVDLIVFRDATNAADTVNSTDAVLLALELSYTTS